MQSLVIDCSAVIPWFLEDEASPWSEQLLSDLPQFVLHVPALWHLELPNVLLTAERRRRISTETRQGLLHSAARLPVKTDTRVVLLIEISTLATTQNLTTYDAAYLELAIRLNALLATQDKALIQAAARCGVPTLAP
jgi:predicted nucleic acid-binding protein